MRCADYKEQNYKLQNKYYYEKQIINYKKN